MRNFIIAAISLLAISCSPGSTNLNVMTFNIRYDNPSDSLNNWQNRKDIVVGVIKNNDVDICGMQEVLAQQYDYLQEQLPDYSFVGVAREDGKRDGEFSNIIFKTDKFDLIESGTFWLSETPEVAGSYGWDAACTRVATWVLLTEKGSGKDLFFINTHLDHRGEMARNNGTALLLERFTTLSQNKPAIITGDFNARPTSVVIKQVLESKLVQDGRSIATVVEGPEWTYHAFGKVPADKRGIIDYIFVNNQIKASQHKTIFIDQVPHISDHNPILLNITID